MPVTPWEDVVGKACGTCHGPATWICATGPICCDCYAGPGLGLVSKEDAQYVHDFFQHYGTIPVEGQ